MISYDIIKTMISYIIVYKDNDIIYDMISYMTMISYMIS